MALITRQSQEHWLAFVQIQQAIQEDDLWTAAWYMSKFLKTPLILSTRITRLLLDEDNYRVLVFDQKVDLLIEMARGHA
ncbi:hypothetical protein MJO29_016872 [Puccinia striiformis f. sp. tritici]|nr:hypothetical protein MJO29_016872 [Puccinia striiformis f. sp. tritici]